MSKLILLISALSLTLSACGSRHSRVQGGNKPVMMTVFGKTDQQLNAIMQKAWGKEWDSKDAKSQELASEISGVGVVSDSEKVAVTIVHADCKVEDVVLSQPVKAGEAVKAMESEQYKVQIKCVGKDQSCGDFTMLISKLNAEKKPEGSVAVFVRQDMNNSQVWWGKAKGEPMVASKAIEAKAKTCEVKAEEPPASDEGKK